MFKPEELLPRETWTLVLSKLSVEDKLNFRCISVSFKKELDSILKNNQDRLCLSKHYDDYEHYFCYDKDHKISSRDTLCFDRTISIKNLRFLSKLMPSLKILQLDPLEQVYLEDYYNHSWNEEFPDYCDEKGRAVPITKIFPQVTCLILPGQTETDNFVGDLSQVKHLTVLYGANGDSTTFTNLDSLEVRTWDTVHSDGYVSVTCLPMPSKRFVAPEATIEWGTLPKTLEVIETQLNCEGYISIGKPHFDSLKILKNHFGGRYGQNENLEFLINFLKDHKESLTELSVKIKTDKQAIELKEIKALAHNLKYFELSFHCGWKTDEDLDAILENLPLGLDNLSIENFRSYEEINPVMEKIMEKVINGDTKRVTFAGVREYYTTNIIEKIVKMKPEPVRVEETNESVFEYRSDSPGSRTGHFISICDIVISL